jgi:hypothetical protein
VVSSPHVCTSPLTLTATYPGNFRVLGLITRIIFG